MLMFLSYIDVSLSLSSSLSLKKKKSMNVSLGEDKKRERERESASWSSVLGVAGGTRGAVEPGLAPQLGCIPAAGCRAAGTISLRASFHYCGPSDNLSQTWGGSQLIKQENARTVH